MLRKLLLGLSMGLALVCQTGCATLFAGKYEQITVNTVNDKAPKATQCVLKNEEGEWKAWANITTVIHRDNKEMNVHCENDEQAGSATVRSSFQGLYLVLDILWDYCILTASCIIDGATNAFFDYPDSVSVEMSARQAMQEGGKAVQQEIKPQQRENKQESAVPL